MYFHRTSKVSADLPLLGEREFGLESQRKTVIKDTITQLKTLPEADKQLRRDNAFTLLAQSNEQRRPFARSEAESISIPTLIVAGANTHGALPIIARVLAEHIQGADFVSIADATHVMFAQQPVAFSEAVLAFLDS